MVSELNKISELWVACDEQYKFQLYNKEPQFLGKIFIADGYVALVRNPGDVDIGLKPGHKAKLTIGELIDCRPRVPELWVYHEHDGSCYMCLDGVNRLAHGSFNSVPFAIILQRGYKSRAAIDENGLRLLGTPERI